MSITKLALRILMIILISGTLSALMIDYINIKIKLQKLESKFEELENAYYSVSILDRV